MIPIEGAWKLNFINHSKLDNILYVPQLSLNLIFIQKLIEELKCKVIFAEKKVLLMDDHNLMKIGEALEQHVICDLDKLLN